MGFNKTNQGYRFLTQNFFYRFLIQNFFFVFKNLGLDLDPDTEKILESIIMNYSYVPVSSFFNLSKNYVLCSVLGSPLEQGFSESVSTVSVGPHASTSAAVKKTMTSQLLDRILHDFEVSDESGGSENDERSGSGKSEQESTVVSICSQPCKGKGPS
jgi:hypothetical protein